MNWIIWNGDDFTSIGDADLTAHSPTGPNAHGSGVWVEVHKLGSTFARVSGSDHVLSSGQASDDGWAYMLNPSPPTPDVRIGHGLVTRESGNNDRPSTLLWRYQDANNYYGLYMFRQGQANGLRIMKCVSGTLSVLAQVAHNIFLNYRVVVDMVGTEITVRRIDDPTNEILLTASDSSIVAAGSVGLGVGKLPNEISGYWVSVNWKPDDFLVEYSLGNLSLPYANDFSAGNLDGWTQVDEGNIDAPGAWSVSGGQCVQTTNIFGGQFPELQGTMLILDNATLWDNYLFQATIQSALASEDDYIGLIFRYVDQNNYYRFLWQRETPLRRVQKVQGGIWTLPAQDTVAYVSNQIYQVRIKANGGKISLHIDDVQIFNFTDPSPIAAGGIGLYARQNPVATYDNVQVNALGGNLNPIIHNLLER